MVKLSDIKGLIKKNQKQHEKPCPEGENCVSCAYMDGFYDAIDGMSEREVILDRDGLADIVRKEIDNKGYMEWSYYDIADVIISTLPTLLVVKEGG